VKRFLFAVALGCLFAANTMADPPATTTTGPVITGTSPGITVGTPVTTGPVITGTSPAPVITTAPAPTPRRGLFGRLRSRSTSSPVMTNAPLTTGTTTITPGVITPGTIVPTPMPPITRPNGGTSVIVPEGTGAVVPTGGITGNGTVIPAGGIITADGRIIPAGSTIMPDGTITAMPAMMPTTTTTTTRMGLLARLRARR
jgi:hypothetical protein